MPIGRAKAPVRGVGFFRPTLPDTINEESLLKYRLKRLAALGDEKKKEIRQRIRNAVELYIGCQSTPLLPIKDRNTKIVEIARAARGFLSGRQQGRAARTIEKVKKINGLIAYSSLGTHMREHLWKVLHKKGNLRELEDYLWQYEGETMRLPRGQQPVIPPRCQWMLEALATMKPEKPVTGPGSGFNNPYHALFMFPDLADIWEEATGRRLGPSSRDKEGDAKVSFFRNWIYDLLKNVCTNAKSLKALEEALRTGTLVRVVRVRQKGKNALRDA